MTQALVCYTQVSLCKYKSEAPVLSQKKHRLDNGYMKMLWNQHQNDVHIFGQESQLMDYSILENFTCLGQWHFRSWKLPWPQTIPPFPPTNQTGPSKEYKFNVVCVPLD
jgi:hypothetical protein